MNESILNHLFLPYHLPSTANDDFLLGNNNKNEFLLLECMDEFLRITQLVDGDNSLRNIRVLTDCFSRWSVRQNSQNISIQNIQTTLENLPSGSFTPLYMPAQNAAIVIEIESNNISRPLLSSWQVLLPVDEITSSVFCHYSSFPVTEYRLNEISELTSKINCELLVDFMKNTIEYLPSHNLPKSHYVCQWWIQQFKDIQQNSNGNSLIQFKKKHRDHIHLNKEDVPFRRSGLWMTMKTVIETILTKQFGELGILIYKLLITHFLIYILDTRQKYSKQRAISMDLSIYCIRKIVRRMNKIENRLALITIDDNDVDRWIRHIKKIIEIKIDEIFPKSFCQDIVQTTSSAHQFSSSSDTDFNSTAIYQHACVQLKTFLNDNRLNKPVETRSSDDNTDDFFDINYPDNIQFYSELMHKMSYTMGTALTRVEIWVTSHLQEWLDDPTPLTSGMNRFEHLREFFEDYQSGALSYYWPQKGSTDPIGYSRFILTSLTIIHCMHKKLCEDPGFERLKNHTVSIPHLLKLFKYLILPTREDMIRARYLYDYFREFSTKTYPDLLSKINSTDAFGVAYATSNNSMVQNLLKIRAQAEVDRRAKVEEVNHAKWNYKNLMKSIRNLSCSCRHSLKDKRTTCEKCSAQEQADNMQVDIFECPIPEEDVDAQAVIFELQMPIEIRSYRDILWQFINRRKPQSDSKVREWSTSRSYCEKLSLYDTGPDIRRVKLISDRESYTEHNYTRKISCTAVDGFLVKNNLTVNISPTVPTKFSDEHKVLTPQLTHPDYKQLQFTLDTTNDMQNEVIAKLPQCPPRFKPTQFIEYGSFRSGHRLQWLNLLAVLEMDSLSIAEESVAILILHSILQYGPIENFPKKQNDSWCPESHQQLLEDNFVDELVVRLNQHLDNCGLNWQNDLVLVVITIVAMRLFTICNTTKESLLIDLVMKCRQIGEKWIERISEYTQTMSSSDIKETEKLRSKMITISIACMFTFSTHHERINCLLGSDEHIMSLLKVVTTLHDTCLLSFDKSIISTFIQNLKRHSERIMIMIQPTITQFLQDRALNILNQFAVSYWTVIRRTDYMGELWKKQNTDPYDGLYTCQYQSKCLSINLITGSFLVDGVTVGYLPAKIILHPLFVRVFGSHVFEVQASNKPHTYVTKYAYHGNRQVDYEFTCNESNQNLLIYETHKETGDRFQLIPHTCFLTDFPDKFISYYSHWMNIANQTIDFRPIKFSNADFLNDKSYTFDIATGHLTSTDTENKQILINQTSRFFLNLFEQYFNRLDDQAYIYMMQQITDKTNAIVDIYLSRLGIAFQYDTVNNIIVSREYADMRVSENQHFGTLTGLTFGLLLVPLSASKNKEDYYPYRKVIIPFGTVTARSQTSDHQTVSVERLSSRTSLEYFVFILNDRLKILQSTDSPTGWLYLALLHAMTTHPLPDQYICMTGMERAFQLLNSAGCWSDEPFNSLSLKILIQIAQITPIVHYYPKNLSCSINISWHANGLPYSTQHFGYYFLAKAIIEHSQQLKFIYKSSSNNQRMLKIFDGKTYNESLMKKLYWDYRDSYNPLARLSTEMEATLLPNRATKPYCSDLEYCLHKTDYTSVDLTDDLYNSGNVHLRDCSNQHWLPLNQWLSEENTLNIIWIGLLKMTDCLKTSTSADKDDNIKRFEKMIDFLHYIADRVSLNPFYLQMLKTALKEIPDTISSIHPYPPFIYYSNIEHIDVQSFQYDPNLMSTKEVKQTNKLLTYWQNNKKLRLFLEDVENSISYPMEEFNMQVQYIPQQFEIESFDEHYKVQLKPMANDINPRLLLQAKEKFHQMYTGYFKRPARLVQTFTTEKKDSFFDQFFPSNNQDDNSLIDIANYFKNQLKQSWQKLSSEIHTQQERSTNAEINECLNHLRQESIEIWQELIKSITQSNIQIFQCGLGLRITPTTLISLFQQNKKQLNLTNDERTLLGGVLVYWTLEQQLERALYFDTHDKIEDLEKELSNIPHSNWIPSEHISWLILELEMNITIREMQIKVARHMMQPNSNLNNQEIQNIVMQMNMGEGKTSVILPMLAVSLPSSSSNLVRIIILKSLFPTNYQSLRCKLGGLINRRVFPFICRRDLNFTDEQIQSIHSRLRKALLNCDIMITSPEDILSYDLLTIDQCRRHFFATGKSMLAMQRWLKTYARDVLDESDEILHVKYQLVYTVGSQRQVDGGAERWNTIQSILKLVKQHAANISNEFDKDVCYKPSERKSAFPQFRLQSSTPFRSLCEYIVKDWLRTRNYHENDEESILTFVMNVDVSIEIVKDKFPASDIQSLLIIRGLLSSEVLLVALKKRYRVNYGANRKDNFNHLMAVPYRAKDVVADRTEFGHPDLALVLTHLSYYYSGLNDEQLTRVFDRLSEEENNPVIIYDEWITYEGIDNLPATIKEWKSVNLKDHQQRTRDLFPIFRYNIVVINYFLNYFVFPREAKQFPHKLVSSPWDLSSSFSRRHIITGFSGTNDTQLLLPIHIRQFDLPELQKTDAIVVNNLLQVENENYQCLAINASSTEILEIIMKSKTSINVILDVGALFIDGMNREIALKWLNLSDKNKIDYAVYFDSDSIVVCDRQLRQSPFATSPASERLEHCIFYLDEIHTRGTDFKFPRGFQAAVTLGVHLTKDRFVQACMRMRKLGNGHSLAFFSSHEVHQQIIQLKKNVNNIEVIDLLRWVYENTIDSTWNGLHYWATQSLSFQRKLAAFREIQWNNQEQVFDNEMMKQLAQDNLEPEILDLIDMYGERKVPSTLYDIHSARYNATNYNITVNIRDEVLQRLRNYGGKKTRLAQLLDEEQERELEQELEEERQLERPPPAEPCERKLHDIIKQLCNKNIPMINLEDHPMVFQHLPFALIGTTLEEDCQPKSWYSNLWISTEFQRVIATEDASLNSFLRPPRWIVVYRNQHIIFVSSYEANWLLGRLSLIDSPITTLRLFLPRIKRNQSIFVNTLPLTIPPSINVSNENDIYLVPLDRLVQLFLFNGTLYFDNTEEQTMFCQCLSLCPKIRNEIEENAFQSHKIDIDGFVHSEHRDELQITHARLKENPIDFVKQILEIRNNIFPTTTSHVGSIILNAFKLF
ncbi:unnamed protein product [Adineta steineri]|uniref:ubiquitinyl hydrolase 1 n=1 Tax=Adineta steineri TaxID=433720 RepID=A0A814H9T2_9BILA|nr:unnamed protein product [Adineta steineri]CAF0979830.1 unnamed protein product [Adineta steineri]CAF1006286.1 unnamed protein product [Adineta steineri]CAF1438556.1 unnamed protein product [Adineta steineri]